MERSDWQDRAKGIGIILVVFGHVMRGLTSAGIMPDDLLNRDVDYTLYTFHMPLFFLLSGLNVEASLARGRSRFIKKRVWTLLWPYVLWSLAQGSIQVVLGGSLNGSLNWSDLAKIGWQPYAQFWFLYVLMLCHLVAIIFGTKPAVLLGLAVAGLALSPYAPYVPQKFLFNLPFYVAGILAARHLWIFEGGWLRTALAILCFALFAILNRMAGGNYDSLGALPAAFCGIAAVIFIVRGIGHAAGRWLCKSRHHVDDDLYSPHPGSERDARDPFEARRAAASLRLSRRRDLHGPCRADRRASRARSLRPAALVRIGQSARPVGLRGNSGPHRRLTLRQGHLIASVGAANALGARSI